ncbi:unnamed protein product [Plutella xylostella]|uniref:(diamondback moth) hypothetical protein n=1 Tax=Plutella xylostella TaxID=51655 RepID=A0A8S4G606_PLUXY|nr:unnamed protein product [Plutella xylostella]
MVAVSSAARLLALICLSTRAAAESWRFPDQTAAEAIKIDSKVQFVDEEKRPDRSQNSFNPSNVQSDEPDHFVAADDTQGFYNRPGQAGRYPVQSGPSQGDDQDTYGLVLTRIRNNNQNSGTGNQDRANKLNSNVFNDENQFQSLLPNYESFGPFPPPRQDSALFTPGGDEGLLEGGDRRGVLVGPGGGPSAQAAAQRPAVLVGPGGPTGRVGPDFNNRNPGVLVGPGGPTGRVGPNFNNNRNPAVLVGPGGPTGRIGPDFSNRNPAVLVGPGGPTGRVGPDFSSNRNPGVLVGPGGPTGRVGPDFNNRNPGVLSGPGGPTGRIGPDYSRNPGILVGPGGAGRGAYAPTYFNPRQNRYRGGLLVGPGGATGTIGPGRGLLVGAGGPTGSIGPQYSDHGL